MLLIAAFAVYAILVRRVHITRKFTLTGSNARVFGFALLILLIPMVLAINFVLGRILPPTVLQNEIASRLIGLAALGALTFGIAAFFRDSSTDGGLT